MYYYNKTTKSRINSRPLSREKSSANKTKEHEDEESLGLPEDTSLFLMNQLVEGMKALRQNNIVHRDLKLQNILMTDNTLKIADFGLSTVLGE